MSVPRPMIDDVSCGDEMSSADDERYPNVPRPSIVLVKSIIPRPPLPGTFTSKEPSPINLFAVIEDAMIFCDDMKEAKSDPELILRDEMVAKLLKYPM